MKDLLPISLGIFINDIIYNLNVNTSFHMHLQIVAWLYLGMERRFYVHLFILCSLVSNIKNCLVLLDFLVINNIVSKNQNKKIVSWP